MFFVREANVRFRTLLLCALFLALVGVFQGELFTDATAIAPPMNRAAADASLAARSAIDEPRDENVPHGAITAGGAREAIADAKSSASRAGVAPQARTQPATEARKDPPAPPATVTPVWRDDARAIAAVLESPQFLDAASPVARLYLAYFGRGPDAEGFDYYVAQREGGRLLDAISDEFAGSREIELRYGELDNAAFVDRVFRNVFGDAGDAQQRDGWRAQLDSGAMTRGQMMLAFSESEAFRTASANQVFVSIAYTEIFGRGADPDELARWVAFLDAGNSGQAVVQGLLASR